MHVYAHALSARSATLLINANGVVSSTQNLPIAPPSNHPVILQFENGSSSAFTFPGGGVLSNHGEQYALRYGTELVVADPYDQRDGLAADSDVVGLGNVDSYPRSWNMEFRVEPAVDLANDLS